MNRRPDRRTCVLIAAIAAVAAGCRTAKLTELQKVRSGAVDVVLLSPGDGLKRGRDAFVIEFRSASGGTLIDVGKVQATATMPMPGTPMFGTIDVSAIRCCRAIRRDSEFSMAGTWRMTIQWDGPAGRGSAAFSGSVQ